MIYFHKSKEILKEEHFEKDVLQNFKILPIEQDSTNDELEKYYSTTIKDSILKALQITESEYEKNLIEAKIEYNKYVSELSTLPKL